MVARACRRAGSLALVLWLTACDGGGASHEGPAPGAVQPPPGTTFRDCPACPEMVVAPSGRFMMGSPVPDRDGSVPMHEAPVHRVTLARPFAVGVTEVTRGQLARFVAATGRWMGNSCHTYENGEWGDRSGRHWKSPGFSQKDGHPVVCVSHTQTT